MQQMIKLKKGKVHIGCFVADTSACNFYRLQSPMWALTKGNTSEDYTHEITGVLERRHLEKKGFNAVIMQRQYMREVFDPMLIMRERGIKLIYEIDDNLLCKLPSENPAAKFFKQRNVQDNIKAFLSNVDAIFVTNQELASVYQDYNRVFVLPNSIDFKVVVEPPHNSKRSVVLWQGSPTHRQDLAVLKICLSKLTKDTDILVKLWHADFPGCYAPPFVDFKSFFPMFSQMDAQVGICVVAPNVFNKSKSNLKFLEYSALKIPTVASDFGEYKIIDHMETGLLCQQPKDFYENIRYLIDNPDERERIGTNAYNFVKENFDIDKNYILWKNAIDEVLAM